MKRLWSTDAIVLSRFDLGEADRVLTLITPHEGKVKAIAKGVRRPTSRLGGSVEPFAELRLQLAHGRTFDVVTQVSVGPRLAGACATRSSRPPRPGTSPSWPIARSRSATRPSRSTAPQARLRAARRRHGAGPGGALVRDAPDRRAGHAARGRPLRRVRPDARAGRHVPLGAAAGRRPVPARPGPAGRADRPQPRRAQAAQGLPAPRHRGARRRCVSRSGPSARSRPRCATSSGSASSATPARCPSSTSSEPVPARGWPRPPGDRARSPWRRTDDDTQRPARSGDRGRPRGDRRASRPT